MLIPVQYTRRGTLSGYRAAEKVFGSVGAFATRTVDFVDVTLYSTYTYTLGGPLGGSAVSFTSRAFWKFWGTGEPIGNPHPGVPEPGTLSLLALGLVGVGFMRRRKAIVL